MPIATCIVNPDCPNHSGDLIELWAKEAGLLSKHMTINLIVSNEQLGNKYGVMATLSLPSAWKKAQISSLQIGLAKALAKSFSLNIREIHVITHIINAGFVVEEGNEVKW